VTREQELTDALRRARDIIARLSPAGRPADDKVAIIGLGCLLPAGQKDAATWGDFFSSLMDGTLSVRPAPADRQTFWQRLEPEMLEPLAAASFLNRPLLAADLERFRLSPAEARLIDPHIHISLEVVLLALDNAGQDLDGLSGSDTGVFFGRGGSDFLDEIIYPSGPQVDHDPYTLTGNLLSSLPGRLSYYFDFRGPSIFIDTACSTSLVAVAQAVRSLKAGECSLAVAGAANLLIGPRASYWLKAMGALAPDGRTKAFSAQANGFGRGEGAAAVILKTLSKAQKDGDKILAVIEGTAVGCDGRSSAFTVNSASAQARVMKAALREAGLTPDEVGYVETHGTGTMIGDPIEAEAMAAVYGQRPRPEPLYIGSVKSNIGHLEAAAGVASLIKAVGIVNQGRIPPDLLDGEPNPLIDWSSGLKLSPAPAPWPNGYSRRVAGVSSFGITGTLAHILVSQPPEEVPGPDPGPGGHLAVPSSNQSCGPLNLYLSGPTESALLEEAESYLERLGQGADFGVLLRTSALRPADPIRSAITASSAAEAQKLLTSLAYNLRPDARSAQPPVSSTPIPLSHQALGLSLNLTRGRTAYPLWLAFSEPQPLGPLGPDGAAETNDYGRELFEAFPVFRDIVQQMAAKSAGRLGLDLIEAMFTPGLAHKESAARDVVWLTYQTATAALLIDGAVKISAVMGRSLGHYAAAVACGLIDIETALELVLLRAAWCDELSSLGAEPGFFPPDGGGDWQARFSPEVKTRLGQYHNHLAGLNFNRLKLPFFSAATATFLESGVHDWPGFFLKLLFDDGHYPQAVTTLEEGGHKVVLEIGPGVSFSPAATQASSQLNWEFLRPSGQQLWSYLAVMGRLWTWGLAGRPNPLGPIDPEVLPPIKFHRQDLIVPEPWAGQVDNNNPAPQDITSPAHQPQDLKPQEPMTKAIGLPDLSSSQKAVPQPKPSPPGRLTPAAQSGQGLDTPPPWLDRTPAARLDPPREPAAATLAQAMSMEMARLQCQEFLSLCQGQLSLHRRQN
jgi:acyl transferase domain-containing protein